MINIHPVQTGKVRVRPGYLQGDSRLAAQLVEGLFSREWSGWMPITAWLIEHPEGLFLVDTGETARTGERGYAPGWSRRFTQYAVDPQDEIGPQLAALGVEAEDVGTVVLTHLHSDRCDGLHAFRRSEILVDHGEHAAASGSAGRLKGYLPHRWPRWFQPKFIEYEESPMVPFARCCPLTTDGRIVAVPTPGHSPGHGSVLVKTDGVTCFLAGDLSLTPETL